MLAACAPSGSRRAAPPSRRRRSGPARSACTRRQALRDRLPVAGGVEHAVRGPRAGRCPRSGRSRDSRGARSPLSKRGGDADAVPGAGAPSSILAVAFPLAESQRATSTRPQQSAIRADSRWLPRGRCRAARDAAHGGGRARPARGAGSRRLARARRRPRRASSGSRHSCRQWLAEPIRRHARASSSARRETTRRSAPPARPPAAARGSSCACRAAAEALDLLRRAGAGGAPAAVLRRLRERRHAPGAPCALQIAQSGVAAARRQTGGSGWS